MPDKFILEPWKAPTVVQKKAGCIIGEDYPLPIVEHKSAKEKNMTSLKEVYAKAKAERKRKAPSAAGPPKKRKKT